MNRKFWTVLLAFAAILCLALTACGGKRSDNGKTETDNSSEEEPAEPLPHDHVYGADNLCTVCGDKWEYSEGLEFTPSADGQSFLVSGAGTAKGNIVIPYGYQGKFVTGIADSAFANGTLTGVELPSSVTSIGENAFFGSHLTYVTIPATVTVIGDSAFGGCVLLITVNIADLAAWCNIEFANGTANPLSQAQHLVVGGEEVTELVIPNGVTKVGDYAFYGCDFLESIVIPDSVTVLGTLVFGDFTVTIVIRFEGTVEQWQELVEGLVLWENGQGNPVDCENGSIDQNGAVTPTPGGQGGQGGQGGEGGQDTPGGQGGEGGQGGQDTPGGEGGQGGEGGEEHTHTYSETWSYDDDFHWHAATCHPTERDEEIPHTYVNGVCTECHFAHQNHTYENGVCTECHYAHQNHTYENGVCTECHFAHQNHTYENGVCTECHYAHQNHTYENGVCTECHYAHQNHTYENGVCTECHFAHAEHTFTYSDKTENGHTGTCSVCHKTVTEGHTYENGVCTECEYEHIGHIFAEYTDKTDDGHTGACSVCHKVVTEGHTYENGVCTECEYEHENHTYGDENTCLVCGAKKPLYTKSTDGTKIYFGEYPQTEVTESGLKGFLGMEAGANPTSDNAGKWTDYGYYINGSVQSYMWYIDVEYQDNRYRGVYFTRYRPAWTIVTSTASYSYQDENGYSTNTVYWFKYEPIEWRILEQKDGTALLMANIILDNQQYYNNTNIRSGSKTIYPNNYKESDIRKWLTKTFYKTAFDKYSQEIIEITTVDNSASTTTSNSNQYVCENTQDKVFLLSYKDVLNTSYGFSSSESALDTTRQLKSTDYAKSQGCWQSTESSYYGNGWWWLRSPHYSMGDYPSNVINDGSAKNYGDVRSIGGVVPALWIHL